ncbi:MAG: FAD:protein FMN transferase [Planctomycetes bacterium]|nr:FAD:protein FMN transferase [Planctomycetota bacterium]
MSPAPQMNMVKLATEAMATRFEVAIWDDRDEAQVRAIAEAAIAEIERWHARLNLFDQASLCGHVARMQPGVTLRLDADEARLVRACLDLYEVSDGAYDIVVSGSRKRGMSNGGTSDDLKLLSDGTLTVNRTGLLLDFGSVAKGFALDMVRTVLMDEDVTCAFVHGGTSSVMTMGVPRDQKCWKVRVGDRVAQLDGTTASCLSVSKPMQGEVRHIADARGAATDGETKIIAAVAHASGLDAEGWSTLLLIDAPRRDEYEAMVGALGGKVIYAHAKA